MWVGYALAALSSVGDSFATLIDERLVGNTYSDKQMLWMSALLRGVLVIGILLWALSFGASIVFSTFVISWSLLGGVLLLIAMWSFFQALAIEDAWIVAAWWLTIWMMVAFMSHFILDEKLSGQQVSAALLITLGAFLLSVETQTGKVTLKWKLVLLMLMSSVCFAIDDVLFRMVETEAGYPSTLFWTYCGYAVIGLVFFRKNKISLRGPREKVRAVLISNTLYVIGDGILKLGITFAPVALVVVAADGGQPIATFLLMILLSRVFHFFKREESKSTTLERFAKLAGFVILLVGALLLAT